MPFPIRLEIVRPGASGADEEMLFDLEEAGLYTIGRDPDKNDIRLTTPQVSRAHAVLDVSDTGIEVKDSNSRVGTFIRGARGEETRVTGPTPWQAGDTLLIAQYELRFRLPARSAEPAARGPQQGPPPRDGEARPSGSPISISIDPKNQADKRAAAERNFPRDVFTDAVVSMSRIRASGYLHAECEYLALGGGIGSFVWVDHLRCYGVSTGAIRVIGEASWNPKDPMDYPRPYYSYRALCTNSQIPDRERLRSNSISTPDNIWGFPGYASRETWREVWRGHLSGFKHVLQVFGEPAFAESYTPRSGDVYRSLDREALRIGWPGMFVPGHILELRKTDDGRYAVAFRLARDFAPDGRRDKIMVARYVHVATGYPAYRTVDDIFEFNKLNAHKKRAVKAYDQHDEIYFALEHSREPALVVVRGRGIVASRILQRLYEARARNPNIRVLHQMRSALGPDDGSRYGRAKRAVFNHTEHQPFNWPKACWGGELRREIEDAPPERRSQIFAALGGTTTADRSDWKRIIAEGLAENWYQVVIGSLDIIGPAREQGRERIKMAYKGNDPQMPPESVVDYVIDCIGLIGSIDNSSFLKNLVETYALPRNRDFTQPKPTALGIAVTPDFEIEGLRNGNGRVHAAGQITGHGPYAAVDSFLGLQYAALRSVDHLHASGAPGVSSFGPLRSFGQWLRWCRGAPP